MKRLAALFVAVLALRLCHLRIVWVEEAYPAAAAIQMSEYSKTLYTDVFFDKPPAAAYFYRLFDAQTGWPLRIAGACFVFACALAAFAAARRVWGSREAYAAAALVCFALSFDHPAAVMAIAPDLLMVLPHLLALWLVASGRFAWAGVACGLAFFANPKAAFVAVVCVLWSRSAVLGLAAMLSSAALLAPFAQGWYEQVWLWGRDYSRDSPFSNPMLEGLKQSGSWIWFHLTLVTAASYAILRERSCRQWALWIGINAIAVCLGTRFAPRYFFQLLPVMVLPAARGLCLMSPRARALTLALLLIPAVRFGRWYPQLAWELAHSQPHRSSQLELGEDSRDAAGIVKRAAHPGDTLFVWGYRPDVHMHARMPLGAPFLDSQPVNGVLADRHLVSSKPSPMRGLRKLETKSTFVVDGLGLLNPALAFDPGTSYRELARTKASIVYRRTED
jgi:hypothetical protein